MSSGRQTQIRGWITPGLVSSGFIVLPPVGGRRVTKCAASKWAGDQGAGTRRPANQAWPTVTVGSGWSTGQWLVDGVGTGAHRAGAVAMAAAEQTNVSRPPARKWWNRCMADP